MIRKNPMFYHHPIFWGGLGFCGLNFLLFGDLFWTGKAPVLSSPQTDLFLHFVAWRQFAFEQLRQGHLVLWNPHYLCGAPFLGGFEAALFYPPNWLYLVLPLAIAINAGIILHVILAGFFTYLWALRRGFHPLAAFMAGAVFMWGGAYYLHVYAGHLPNLCTMVWAPLLFLSIDGLAEKISARWIFLGIFTVAMQILAGHPQYAYFTAIVALIYACLSLSSTKSKMGILGGLALIYTGAILVTAVQLWTGLEAFTECGRNIPLEYRSAGSFSFPPENILTLFLPEFFGNLTTTHYWGRWYLWEVSLFTGVVATFLAVLAMIEGNLIQKRVILATAAIAFIFSMGAYTPLYHFFYDHVPFFKGFRGICKFDYLVSLFLAMLAGMGMDRLIKNKNPPQWTFIFSVSMAIFLLGTGFCGCHFVQEGLSGPWAKWFESLPWLKKTVDLMDNDQKQTYIQESGWHASLALWIGGWIFLLLSLLLRFRTWNQKMIHAIAALSIFELFVFARSNRPTFELTLLQKKFDEIQNLYSRDPGDYRVYGTASASLVTGGFDIWEDEPMVLGRYGRFVCASQGLSENQLFSVLPIFKKFTPTFGLLRLKYILSTDVEPMEVYPTRFKLLPRMKLVHAYEVVKDTQELMGILLNPPFDLEWKVLLEESPVPLPAIDGKGGVVSWKDLSTDEIEITADLPQAELLLITDNYSKGWKARAFPESVQGQYQIMPADYFLRAIPLSAGKHHFLLEYRPTAFQIGKWVSIFSTILYVVGLLFWVRKESIFKRK